MGHFFSISPSLFCTAEQTAFFFDNSVPRSLQQTCWRLIKNNGHLTSIDLYGDTIGGDAGAVALALSLRNNTKLQELSLVNNKIGVNGATALGEALVENACLIKCCIYGARVAECQRFAAALHFNTTLKVLSLFCCKIDDSGAATLGRGLQDNCTLQELDLEGNHIGNAGAKEFSVALECNKGLKCLNLVINPIDSEGATALIRTGLAHNFVLEEFWFYTDCPSLQQEKDLYIRLNRAGRRLLKEEPDTVADSEWAIVLAKVREEPDLLYYFCVENPSMFARVACT